ncbi:hypothetical protein JTB14_001934 [Gonioctena quinquepunctata]|nr:hypothetical protein JTB14_001934 [Gonioctena quinquepunctata]
MNSDFIDTLSVDDEAPVFSGCGEDSDAEDEYILENLQKRSILRGPQQQKQGFAKLNLRMNRITILMTLSLIQVLLWKGNMRILLGLLELTLTHVKRRTN